MSFDTCPLCGTSVAVLRSRERRSEVDRLRARVAMLRRRATDLDEGELTPRALKDEFLWMCPDCRPLTVGLGAERGELQRRIHEHVGHLERTIAVLARRAG